MIKEKAKDGSTVYKYVKCPVCGSKNRHTEKMCEKAIKAGTVAPGFIVAFIYDHKMLIDPIKEASLPVGAEIPAITIAAEVCRDCGCVYAPLVITGKAKKSVTTDSASGKKKIWLPGQSSN